MKKLATDKALRSTLGNNGLEYISKHFSADTITKAWASFYKNLLRP